MRRSMPHQRRKPSTLLMEPPCQPHVEGGGKADNRQRSSRSRRFGRWRQGPMPSMPWPSLWPFPPLSYCLHDSPHKASAQPFFNRSGSVARRLWIFGFHPPFRPPPISQDIFRVCGLPVGPSISGVYYCGSHQRCRGRRVTTPLL